MTAMNLRKPVTLVDEIHPEGGRPSRPRTHRHRRRRHREPVGRTGLRADLGPGIDSIAPQLGALSAPLRQGAGLSRGGVRQGRPRRPGRRGRARLGLIHTLKFGDHFRPTASATTLLPAVEKRAAAGTVFDIPLKHITDATVRSHHQCVEVRIPDAPRADELLIALAAAAQGRPQARLAPLKSEQ